MWTSKIDSSFWPPSPGSRGDAAPTKPPRPSDDARPVKARTRRRMVVSLRRLATYSPPRDAASRRLHVLLPDRVAAVRTELLEIAALLEHAAQPDPACVAALHRLLSDGCESPLYNFDVHPSELRATLYYVRSEL